MSLPIIFFLLWGSVSVIVIIGGIALVVHMMRNQSSVHRYDPRRPGERWTNDGGPCFPGGFPKFPCGGPNDECLIRNYANKRAGWHPCLDPGYDPAINNIRIPRENGIA
jgi:hypothetical protein